MDLTTQKQEHRFNFSPGNKAEIAALPQAKERFGALKALLSRVETAVPPASDKQVQALGFFLFKDVVALEKEQYEALIVAYEAIVEPRRINSLALNTFKKCASRGETVVAVVSEQAVAASYLRVVLKTIESAKKEPGFLNIFAVAHRLFDTMINQLGLEEALEAYGAFYKKLESFGYTKLLGALADKEAAWLISFPIKVLSEIKGLRDAREFAQDVIKGRSIFRRSKAFDATVCQLISFRDVSTVSLHFLIETRLVGKWLTHHEPAEGADFEEETSWFGHIKEMIEQVAEKHLANDEIFGPFLVAVLTYCESWEGSEVLIQEYRNRHLYLLEEYGFRRRQFAA